MNIDRIGAHANKIRTAFLDNISTLEEVIPANYDFRKELLTLPVNRKNVFYVNLYNQ